MSTSRLSEEDESAVGDAANTSANHAELRNRDLGTGVGGDEAGRAGGGRSVAGRASTGVGGGEAGRAGGGRSSAGRASTGSASAACRGDIAAGGAVAAGGSGHDGVVAGVHSSALDGDTPLVKWGLMLLASLDTGRNGQEGQKGRGEVHYGFWVDGAEAIGSRRRASCLTNDEAGESISMIFPYSWGFS